MLVKKKMPAVAHVVLVRKLPAPLPPNTCWAPPPPSAPRPPLLPGWIKITRIRKAHAMMCKTVNGVCRKSAMLSSGSVVGRLGLGQISVLVRPDRRRFGDFCEALGV